MSISLCSMLHNIGVSGPVRIPGKFKDSCEPAATFQICPVDNKTVSLRAIMRAMQPSDIASWTEAMVSNVSRDWTDETQGIATDGSSWFISTKERVYKFDWSFKQMARTSIPERLSGYNHFSAMSFFEGKLYVPLEYGVGTDDEHDKNVMIRVYDSNLNYLYEKTLNELGGQGPWCAVNPWNGYLYISKISSNELLCYDSRKNLSYAGKFKLQEKVTSIQGGCFSKNGRLYLTSNSSRDIRCYCVLNGHFMGRMGVSYERDGVSQEEMEGLTIVSLKWPDQGKSAQIHVIILDNELLSSDEIFIRHFRSPSPETV